ncbi:MAG TPA: transglycosylase SLT domain-containing protein [Kofleriaceae bacterium]|nr:transglycosylase SLT domain-containing protein [Kofleriaceae bacterium]
MVRFNPFIALLISVTATAAGCATQDDGGDDEIDLAVTAEDEAADAEFGLQVSDGKEDGALSYTAVARLAKNAGIPCSGERIAIATAVARAESSFRPTITNTVGNAHGIDRGLWQINSYWHPEVSKECALSASCNARAAARISSKGTKWRQWWTFVNNKHLPFMSQARAAQRAVCQ